jgi:glycosyltransferase involved in cell wall biosynthesis
MEAHCFPAGRNIRVTERLKILLYSHFFFPSTGGVENAARILAEYLSREGEDVIVLTQTPGNKASLPVRYMLLRKPNLFSLFRIVRSSDVIYTMGFNLPVIIVSLLYRRQIVWDHPDHDLVCPKNIAWDGEDTRFAWRRCIQCLERDWPIRHVIWLPVSLVIRRAVSSFVRFHVVHSEYMMQEVVHLLGHSERTAITRLPRFIPDSSTREMAPTTMARPMLTTILFVGRLIREKGVQILLRAIRVLGDCKIRVIIIGDGVYRDTLEKMAKDLSLGDLVLFAGSRPQGEVDSYFDLADIVVIPSVWQEPFGQGVLQAMSHGKPLVVSRSGALPEMVDGSGLIFERGDFVELARKIRMLMDDSDLASALGKRGLELARRYSEKKIAPLYLRLLSYASNEKSAQDAAQKVGKSRTLS